MFEGYFCPARWRLFSQTILIRQTVLDWHLKSSARAKPLREHLSTSRMAKEEFSADQINQATRLLPDQAKAIFGAPVDLRKVINEPRMQITNGTVLLRTPSHRFGKSPKIKSDLAHAGGEHAGLVTNF